LVLRKACELSGFPQRAFHSTCRGRLVSVDVRTYLSAMCGRVIQSSGPLRYAIVDGMNVRDSRVHNYPARWNAAPSQELLVIRRNHRTGEVSLDPLRWGLIPYWCQDPAGGRKPINAKCETVRTCRRSEMPTGNGVASCPWTDPLSGRRSKAKRQSSPTPLQRKTVRRSGSPEFGRTGKNRHRAGGFGPSRSSPPIPTSWSPDVHDRMPVILAAVDYARWLSL
jgi:SOS response associated peptidase (SRAP)